ncbi:cytochrome and DOMON domain-containing protein [Veronia pacifica]|uniref:Ferric reductase n=1 Tax=Veronia pacifica TaxID=1080227 RepID=A0A1C3EEV3_9GAMM|nr:cytochrome and DOMON domain-containing protein [Veronia pacifica]ODA31782.1 ferric reductase [Veronia pacifica]
MQSILISLACLLLCVVSPAYSASSGEFGHTEVNTTSSCDGFSHQKTLLDSDLTMCWNVTEDGMLDIKAYHPGEVWIGLGFGKNMSNADAIIGYLTRGEVADSHMTGRFSSSITKDEHQNIHDASIVSENGVTVMVFKRPIVTSDPTDAVLNLDQDTDFLWAVGDGRRFNFHSEFGVQQLHFGDGSQAERRLSILIVMHAALMVLAWGIMSPVIITVTRYFKVTPGQNFPVKLDNKFWWITHWIGHSISIALSAVALILSMFALNGIDTSTLHAKLGFVVLGMSMLQATSGFKRGTKGGPVDDDGYPIPRSRWYGDHYNMTIYRRMFEWVHKTSGYIILIASHFTIYSGFFLFSLGAWAYLLLFGIELMMVVSYVLFSLQRRWIDTYHAIWGFSRRHPGNRFSRTPYREDK